MQRQAQERTAAEEADEQPEHCGTHAEGPALARPDYVRRLDGVVGHVAHRERLQDVEHRQDGRQQDPVRAFHLSQDTSWSTTVRIHRFSKKLVHQSHKQGRRPEACCVHLIMQDQKDDRRRVQDFLLQLRCCSMQGGKQRLPCS